MTKSLHVTFIAETTAAICREAEARKLRPQVLVAAAMRGVLVGGLLDAVLDGDNPRQLAGGHARDPETGLTLIQEGIIYLIGLHSGKDGHCYYSAPKFCELIQGGTPSGVQNALSTLVAAGLIARGPKMGVRGVPPHRLTRAGQALFAKLSGAEAEGGET